MTAADRLSLVQIRDQVGLLAADISSILRRSVLVSDSRRLDLGLTLAKAARREVLFSFATPADRKAASDETPLPPHGPHGDVDPE